MNKKFKTLFLAALLGGSPVFASVNANSEQTQRQDKRALADAIQYLIDNKALKLSPDEELVIKKSLVDELRDSGMIDMGTSEATVVCIDEF